MKRIGTIKFYREWEYILQHSSPYYFKDSLMIIMLDYLNNYSLAEIDLAMENIKKYFYPEFLHFYEAIRKYYPHVIQIMNHFSSSIGKDIIINIRSETTVLSFSDDILKPFEDNSINELFRLILNNINKQISHQEFVDSIVLFNKNLDVFATIISRTMGSFLNNYNRIQKSISGGTEYFEYWGRSSKCKNFCKDKVNKNFHIDQILRMDNKEMTSVLYFCGGLGCHHTFEPNPFYKKGNKK